LVKSAVTSSTVAAGIDSRFFGRTPEFTAAVPPFRARPGGGTVGASDFFLRSSGGRSRSSSGDGRRAASNGE